MLAKETFSFLSSDGITKIICFAYLPSDKPAAVVQLIHGMCEYTERYEELAYFLNDNNIILISNDHIGHGRTVTSKEDYGYFGEMGSYKNLIEDTAKLTGTIKEKYQLPVILFGHSMGAYIAQVYLSKYSEMVDGAILTGTGARNPVLPVGLMLSSIISKIKGSRFRSKLLYKMSNQSFNKGFEGGKTGFEWLSREQNICDKYAKDVMCNYIFTASAYYLLFKLYRKATDRNWAKYIQKDIPILVASGSNDPVGSFGKGPKQVFKGLQKYNINSGLKIYPDARHELTNETNRDQVYSDFINYIYKNILKEGVIK
ncbi:MAG: hypothetical protein A2Y17_08880 [Clostridiales bacterium GWF2_38_85]|nr:MAG: hypothetical protein A2Y17_08880 [Clostridiales bacterium GWF2_38_85]HBL83690.1 alpha/beta hydrolase [Clostridiales bacterium]